MELNSLKSQNEELIEENLALKQKLSFWVGHKTLASGTQGEDIIVKLIGGKPTSHTKSYDIVLDDGNLIEVKYSKMNTPSKGSETRRWAWGKVFGEQGTKKYDYLILIGETDKRFNAQYVSKNSPYVLFVVPYSHVYPLTIKTKNTRAIQLTTNPEIAKSNASPLFSQYQINERELKLKFGL